MKTAMSVQFNVQLLYVYTELYTDVVGIIVVSTCTRCPGVLLHIATWEIGIWEGDPAA